VDDFACPQLYLGLKQHAVVWTPFLSLLSITNMIEKMVGERAGGVEEDNDVVT
jgi:hypothetical protein